MADENEEEEKEGQDSAGDDCPPVPKCEECVPGLPGWMATFSDLVTLLLTFFVLLLSFAKTETAKYEAALGSVRNAFGGNVFQKGEVLQPGKSPDDTPEMIDAQNPVKPFPIDFMTMEGLLDKHEINRESTETLREMREVLKEFELSDNVSVEQLPEGIKVRVKDMIFFEKGSTRVSGLKREVLDRLVDLLRDNSWKLFIEGHADKGEVSPDGSDALSLSSKRAEEVTRNFVQNGIALERMSMVSYGDSRPVTDGISKGKLSSDKNRRVEFILRKVDLRTQGNEVDSR